MDSKARVFYDYLISHHISPLNECDGVIRPVIQHSKLVSNTVYNVFCSHLYNEQRILILDNVSIPRPIINNDTFSLEAIFITYNDGVVEDIYPRYFPTSDRFCFCQNDSVCGECSCSSKKNKKSPTICECLKEERILSHNPDLVLQRAEKYYLQAMHEWDDWEASIEHAMYMHMHCYFQLFKNYQFKIVRMDNSWNKNVPF